MMKKITFGLLMLAITPLLSTAQTTSCTPHDLPGNPIRSKAFIDQGQMVANDFHLSANTLNFSVEKLRANLWTEDGEIAAVTIVFHENDNGHPGAVIGDTVANIIPTSQLIIGIDHEDDFEIRDVILDLPTPFDLVGSGTAPKKYWVQLIATASNFLKSVGWEVNGVHVDGEGVNYSNSTINYWIENDTWDGVFSISGECTIAEGCLIPENLKASNITTSSAEISWEGSPEASNYELEYGHAGFVQGSGTIVTLDAELSTFILDELDSVTSYDVYMKTICSDEQSIYSIPLTFKTVDDYCEIETIEITEPISYVEFAGIQNTTSTALDGTPGHEFFLEMVADVEPGSSYNIIVRGNTGGDYDNGITAFIDWNQDGILNNTTERYDIGVLTNSNGEDGQEISTTIVVPANALPGTTRLRIIKEFYSGEHVMDACFWVSYGQIEDYSVEVASLGTDQFDLNSFSFFPNPAKEILSFQATTPVSKLVFYNALGQEVLRKSVNATSSQVDISSLSKGLYFMEVNIHGESKTFKVLRE